VRQLNKNNTRAVVGCLSTGRWRPGAGYCVCHFGGGVVDLMFYLVLLRGHGGVMVVYRAVLPQSSRRLHGDDFMAHLGHRILKMGGGSVLEMTAICGTRFALPLLFVFNRKSPFCLSKIARVFAWLHVDVSLPMNPESSPSV